MRRLLAILILLAGCRPDFGPSGSLVDGPRLLAVRAEPAEAKPGAEIAYTAFLAASGGGPIEWSFCATPKPLGENNIVARACLDSTRPIMGTAASLTAKLPTDGCSLFGPDLPPQIQGQPPQRPRDADATGGYFQPVRLRSAEVLGFGLTRITCNLANASVDVALDFVSRYRANTNPAITALDAPGRVTPGQVVRMSARWDAASAERFPVLDTTINGLRDERESLRVSWFADAGSFATEITGRAGDDLALSTDNQWTAPETPGVVHVWLVLRDSRGGIDVLAGEVTVGH